MLTYKHQKLAVLEAQNDESNWRAIIEYFSPVVQLGLTATPKSLHNIDTYKYFCEFE